MKFKNAIKKGMVAFLLVTSSFVSSVLWAEVEVGYVESVSATAGYIQVADQVYRIGDLTPIMRHGEEYRLPLSSITTGNLVALDVAFDVSIEGMRANSITVLPDESVIPQYKTDGGE